MSSELAERLETVRSKEGLTVTAFWRKVVGEIEEDGPYEWSDEEDENTPRVGYRTAYRYHRGEREPSAEYLARVADVFDVRAEWLLRGKGSMRRFPWERGFIHHPLYRALEDRDFFDTLPLVTLGDQWRFLDVHRMYEVAGGRRHPPGKGPGPLGRNDIERAEDVRFLLKLPLIAFGYGHVRDVPREYWRGVMDALDAAVRTFIELQPREEPGKLREPREIRDEPGVITLREAWEGENFQPNTEE